MKIKTSVKLSYQSKDVDYHEGLVATIKFREKGKIFKTKLNMFLIKHSNCLYRDYLNDSKEMVSSKEKLHERVSEVVNKYFDDVYGDSRVRKILDGLEDKFEVEVEIE